MMEWNYSTVFELAYFAFQCLWDFYDAFTNSQLIIMIIF